MRSSKNFSAIAQFVSKHRKLKGISQMSLAKKIGYKNGQFISNIERGLCSIPPEKAKVLCKELVIDSDLDYINERLVDAVVLDYENNYRSELAK